MLNYSRLTLLLLSFLCTSAGCSRSQSLEDIARDQPAETKPRGDDAAIGRIRAAVHAMTQPQPTVDQVAAEMEGVIMARTKNQALMHYDGYRVTLTTPGDRVTQVSFQFVEAKPSVRQLNELFGTSREVRQGLIYEHQSAVTSSRLMILAEPVSMPPDDESLVRRIVISGAHRR